MIKKINTKIKLNDGNEMPIYGIGTFLLNGRQIQHSLKEAMNSNYIMIDTAQFYNNEYDIGEFLNKKKIFLISKVWISNYKLHTISSIKESIKRLNVKSIDLMLLHMPYRKDFSITIHAYKKLMSAKKMKLVKSIGVSNFSISDLKKLYVKVHEWPAVNQLQISPSNYESKLIKFCRKNNIIVQGYSLLKPLGKGVAISGKLTEKEIAYLKMIGNKYKKSAQQIILRWAVDNDFIIFPKSTLGQRIKSNADIFDFKLTKNEIKNINKMNKNRKTPNEKDIITKLINISNKWGINFKKGLLYEQHSKRLYLLNKSIESIYNKKSPFVFITRKTRKFINFIYRKK